MTNLIRAHADFSRQTKKTAKGRFEDSFREGKKKSLSPQLGVSIRPNQCDLPHSSNA